jgi:hypothetical protein
MQTALTHRSATDLERRDPFGFWTLHWPECLWTFPSVSSMAGDGMLHIHAERRQELEIRIPSTRRRQGSRSPSAPADRPGRPAVQGPRWR